MDTHPSADARALTRLRESHPGWDIERFGALKGGRDVWMATRTRVLTAGEMRGGLLHSLIGDAAERLRDALADQRRIELGAARERAR
ncbi:MAG: hypothetical protein ACRDOO_16960 [Actinomadura sp.]